MHTPHCGGKAHAQEFTDHFNSIDNDIKWTTEVEIIVHTQSEVEVNIDTRTERALALLDTWLVANENGSIRPKCIVRKLLWTMIFDLGQHDIRN